MALQVNSAGYQYVIRVPSTALLMLSLYCFIYCANSSLHAEGILLRRSLGRKPDLSHLIEAKPCGSHRFVTKVTNQISIQYSRMQDFLIKRWD